jgi:hypothetical protein
VASIYATKQSIFEYISAKRRKKLYDLKMKNLPVLLTALVISGSYAFTNRLPQDLGLDLPAYFLLAGDSTTAPQNAAKTGGGWGDGFLNFTLKQGAGGKNYGHNVFDMDEAVLINADSKQGATTVSYRNGGDWTNILNDLKSHTGSYSVYVTIQVFMPLS